jgi:hypothetical protein
MGGLGVIRGRGDGVPSSREGLGKAVKIKSPPGLPRNGDGQRGSNHCFRGRAQVGMLKCEICVDDNVGWRVRELMFRPALRAKQQQCTVGSCSWLPGSREKMELTWRGNPCDRSSW